MKSIVRYTLLTATRDWLFLGIFLLVLLATCTSVFFGSTALVEQKMMSAAYIAGASRAIAVIGLVLFVCFHVRRLFENKEVELILTKPISRWHFIASYFAGFLVLAAMIVAPMMMLILALNRLGLVSINEAGTLIWSLSLYLEIAVTLSIAFFAALLLSSAVTSVLFSFSFYFFARIFGFFLISINSVSSVSKSSKLSIIMEKILDMIGIVIPRFDMLTKSEWLIYGCGDTKHTMIFLLSALCYVPFILVMAAFDFSRKQF